ncbi:3-hydroxyacyl-CoA dehydrogenase/enoyl-CoA hydratase family protein [Bacillus sonorensis]|uniref:3-hydroxyacyl-CoA dehydrogenase/enoyl-CoA hydratase family protein n=1 Tax=Bacillus sonorensis TaxID=119858 RepID=UPI00227F6E15|nr:3-hydroxyacyl-CoA dehydrogenase/enoyl-CoA hydratase family protein [Bacillus sonorensis]MCZ0068805.1 3-hydroxyacyl-CoA dehydrogenase/enoyl-CoA hydratase family protein [Bacillus sonorensis]MCZ0095199.1 3-hydroxyacyl-CoA dehydrogenase/enoyl-CoA hydratase family protein [Bacillus sonorensis]MEC1518222.1 3-hydroxyacyl-CoA dehydrogenase/enoyl-CoA hydratase family protein [Bacillus sonorensis]
MVKHIRKAAVLGSGVMGSGIAAHLANIGIPVLMLDMVPNELTEEEEKKGRTLQDPDVRNRLARTAVKRLLKQKPAPLTSKKNIGYITTGNMEDDFEKIKEADWIIEVVVENLDIKKQVFSKVDQYRKQGSIVSSNTSGISVKQMAEGRSQDFKKHFLGTHFFNPARYLKLLEIIPIEETDLDILSFMKAFGEDVLGKGVVVAKDTPNFIANRIGTYGLLVTVQEMLKGGYSVGEVDSITGPLIGRPKSATFRTLDVVGLDTFSHVAKNVHDQVEGEEKKIFRLPEFIDSMLQNGWIGSKAKQGFYKKEGKDIFELDPMTMTYGERKKINTPGLEAAKQMKGCGARMKALVYSDDRAGTLLWNITAPTLAYSAALTGKIADSITAVDQAMKWGFGWSEGPFEMWDSIGVKKSVAKLEAGGWKIADWVKEMLGKGHESFYLHENGKTFFYDIKSGDYRALQENKKNIHLSSIKETKGVIKKNSGASLIDLGDDVALLEFHSKSNAIGFDIIQMLNAALDEVDANYKGLVIGNQGKNFCVGANLAMMLMEAQDENYFEIDMIIRQFQQTMMRVKYSSKPVVAAPFGMTLGGGTELCLPAARVQASSESYMGLVETGVGLIPGGGGNKELYLNHIKGLPEGGQADIQQAANRTFETIALAKTSTSAHEARELNILTAHDQISMNQDHLLYDAKSLVLALYEAGYRPPVKEKVRVVGETGYAALLLGAEALMLSGAISDHDMKIAKKLAFVIAGGRVPYGAEVSEEYLLDLEREAFLSLVGEPKSQARMQHMLVKGKPLRN